VHGDLEAAAGEGLDRLGQHFGTAEDGVERTREAGSQAPAHSRLCVNGRRNASGQNAGDASVLDEGTTIH